MKALVGAIVSLYYDSPGQVAPGDVLVTRSRRYYLLVEVRQQERGLHRGRWHLKAQVVACPPVGAVEHPIYWYPRGKRKPRISGS